MAGPALKPVRVGCSGWQYGDWRGAVYPARLPQRRWLEHYATLFDTVEVNATFYRLPTVAAVAGWVQQTPPGFCFTIKVSRYATHMKRLTTVADSARRLAERVAPLVEAGRMGPWLWQLPERFRRDDDRLAAALDALPAGRHAFELRHPSWFCAPVWDLLRAHGVAAVIGHDRRRPLPDTPLTTDWTLIRLHYGQRGRGGNYSATELRDWARRIDTLRSDAEVLVYLNNDWQAFAPRNALALRGLLAHTPQRS